MDIMAEVIWELARLTEQELYDLLLLLRAGRRENENAFNSAQNGDTMIVLEGSKES